MGPEPKDDLIYASGRDVTSEKERQAELEVAHEALWMQLVWEERVLAGLGLLGQPASASQVP